MNIDASIDPFWVLYLINVFQPVARDVLESEARALLRAMPARSDSIDVEKWLHELVESGLVILRSDGLHAVTSLGLERLSQFKFGRIRDKNRLFVLKKRLKEG